MTAQDFEKRLAGILQTLTEQTSTHMLNMRLAPELTAQLVTNAEMEAAVALRTLLNEGLDSTYMVLTDDLPSLLTQDEVARVRQQHKSELRKVFGIQP